MNTIAPLQTSETDKSVSGNSESHHVAAMPITQKYFILCLLQSRIYRVIDNEVEETSEVVENSAVELSEKFRTLGQLAVSQSRQISEIVEKSQTVQVSHQSKGYEDVLNEMGTILDDMVQSLVGFSKEAMRLVFDLEDVNKDVHEMAKALENIDNINRQTQYLSINAAIESRKASNSTSGASFDIIANEIRDLSKDTASLAEYVKTRMSKTMNGIEGTYHTLRTIAENDLEPQIKAKEKIENDMAALMNHNQQQSEFVKEALSANEDIEKMIKGLTMTMQFQDFSKQKLQHVSEALAFMQDMLSQIQQDYAEQNNNVIDPQTESTDETIQELIADFLENCSLGEVKTKFIHSILNDNAVEKSHSAYTNKQGDITDTDDDIELF